MAVSYLPRPQVTHVEDRGAPTSATSPLSPAAIYPPLQPTGVAQLVIMRKKCSRMSTGNVFNSQSDLGLETLLSVFLFERPKLQMIVLIFRALFHVKESKDPEKTQETPRLHGFLIFRQATWAYCPTSMADFA